MHSLLLPQLDQLAHIFFYLHVCIGNLSYPSTNEAIDISLTESGTLLVSHNEGLNILVFALSHENPEEVRGGVADGRQVQVNVTGLLGYSVIAFTWSANISNADVSLAYINPAFTCKSCYSDD